MLHIQSSLLDLGLYLLLDLFHLVAYPRKNILWNICLLGQFFYLF